MQAGQQYRVDSDYVGHVMEAFNDRTSRLKAADIVSAVFFRTSSISIRAERSISSARSPGQL